MIRFQTVSASNALSPTSHQRIATLAFTVGQQPRSTQTLACISLDLGCSSFSVLTEGSRNSSAYSRAEARWFGCEQRCTVITG